MMGVMIFLMVAVAWIVGWSCIVHMIVQGEKQCEEYKKVAPKIDNFTPAMEALVLALARYEDPLLFRVPTYVEDWFYADEAGIEKNYHFWQTLKRMEKMPTFETLEYVGRIQPTNMNDHKMLYQHKKKDGHYLRFKNDRDAMIYKLAITDD